MTRIAELRAAYHAAFIARHSSPNGMAIADAAFDALYMAESEQRRYDESRRAENDEADLFGWSKAVRS